MLIAASLWMATAAAAGSWVASAPAVNVAMAEREASSETLAPPTPRLARGERIGSIRWRYRIDPGVRVSARLCHPVRCVVLPGPRGQTDALAGLDARGPLRFRFALAERGQGAARVEGLQVIVNHAAP
ncbi:flagellar protein FlhE [Billgrantia gudaonensis]|uniref:Flagellar protein FlhE n=1 Tax=Billgrantia gudaonensis TaxID=376427 RepID=A0A1G9D560_9GAMM|nr:flagellar protein FlhE [Halomonas gudaonensis]SDK59062.1 flagellar protein FlhE [Halomonas gudaonensis]